MFYTDKALFKNKQKHFCILQPLLYFSTEKKTQINEETINVFNLPPEAFSKIFSITRLRYTAQISLWHCWIDVKLLFFFDSCNFYWQSSTTLLPIPCSLHKSIEELSKKKLSIVLLFCIN